MTGLQPCHKDVAYSEGLHSYSLRCANGQPEQALRGAATGTIGGRGYSASFCSARLGAGTGAGVGRD